MKCSRCGKEIKKADGTVVHEQEKNRDEYHYCKICNQLVRKYLDRNSK